MRFDTNAIHGGYDPKEHRGHLTEPIYMDVAVVQPDCKTAEEIFSGKRPGQAYARYGTENDLILEKRVALLEGGESAKCFSTGLAAINCLLLALTRNGDHIVSQRKIYGGTYQSLRKDFTDAGRKVTFVDDINNPEKLKKAIQKRTKAILVEPISNPTLEVLDMESVVNIARQHKIPLIVDNTFLTPRLFRPIEYGADIVAHSGTKYFTPGGTNMVGIIIGKEEIVAKVRERADTYGASLSPFDAWLTLRGLGFLSVRIERQSESAYEIAHFLERQAQVERVYYPKLMSSRNYFLAKKYFPEGCGAVVSVELKGGREEAVRFAESLKIFSLAVNLGDTRGLNIPPAWTTHSKLTPEERSLAGISDTLIRLSVGLEDAEDLKEDLEQALRAIEK